MDGRRFDELARALATGRSRRGVLKWLAGGVVVGAAGRSAEEAEAASHPNTPCTTAGSGSECPAGAVCVVGNRGRGRCKCDHSQGPSEWCREQNACINTRSDDAGNCGACGRTCSTGENCCGGRCRNVLDGDRNNCGDCGRRSPGPCCDGIPCDEGEWCSRSQAGDGSRRCCPRGSVACHEICCDAETKCCGGLCCPRDRRCSNDFCCAPGTVGCSELVSNAPGCSDLRTDNKNCGRCGNECNSCELCEDGACVPSLSASADGTPCCAEGHEACDQTCCGVGETCCDGTCVDRQTSPQHCGTCGHACASGETCAGGQCQAQGCEAGGQPIAVRGESCCPTGSGNSYFCGRFKCVGFLTGTGPGGCDLWCDLPEEGGLCGPGVDGIPTGEGNGRACCCTVPGTETCVWP